jgi:amidase
MVTSTLKNNGHTLVPWKTYRHAWAVDTTNKIYAADGSAVSRLPPSTPQVNG